MKCDLHRLRAAKRRQKKLRHSEEQVGKPKDTEITHPFPDDRLIRREHAKYPSRKCTDQDEQHRPDYQRRVHRCRPDLLKRLCLLLPPVLAPEDHQPVPQRHDKLLVYELDLIDRRHARKRRLTVRAQHDIIRQVHT